MNPTDAMNPNGTITPAYAAALRQLRRKRVYTEFRTVVLVVLGVTGVPVAALVALGYFLG